jgi:hypothetical protein
MWLWLSVVQWCIPAEGQPCQRQCYFLGQTTWNWEGEILRCGNTVHELIVLQWIPSLGFRPFLQTAPMSCQQEAAIVEAHDTCPITTVSLEKQCTKKVTWSKFPTVLQWIQGTQHPAFTGVFLVYLEVRIQSYSTSGVHQKWDKVTLSLSQGHLIKWPTLPQNFASYSTYKGFELILLVPLDMNSSRT